LPVPSVAPTIERLPDFCQGQTLQGISISELRDRVLDGSLSERLQTPRVHVPALWLFPVQPCSIARTGRANALVADHRPTSLAPNARLDVRAARNRSLCAGVLVV
jgi:hypothetical protein